MRTLVILRNTQFIITVVKGHPDCLQQPGYICEAGDLTSVIFSNPSAAVTILYQWLFNNGSLTGATNAMLTLTNVSPLRAGNYQIIVTNDYGSATSSVVSLTLTNLGGSTNVVYAANEARLRAALSIGGCVTLAFNGTLTLTNTIEITNNVTTSFLDKKP